MLTGTVQTNLISSKANARSTKMTDNVDHSKLCQWLNAVGSQRNKNAFTHLFRFFAPKIQRIAQTKFPNEAQAKEVVQETMSNVWRKAHLFDQNKGAATTWVYRVMRNVTFDMLRKIKGNKESNLSDDIWPLVESEMLESTVTQDAIFDDHLESKQLLSVIEKLPEVQQQVVKGFYFLEMSQEQLAVHLDLPLGTIKSRLRLALAKLKVQLGENHD